jgi:hypothetical protein
MKRCARREIPNCESVERDSRKQPGGGEASMGSEAAALKIFLLPKAATQSPCEAVSGNCSTAQ